MLSEANVLAMSLAHFFKELPLSGGTFLSLSPAKKQFCFMRRERQAEAPRIPGEYGGLPSPLFSESGMVLAFNDPPAFLQETAAGRMN